MGMCIRRMCKDQPNVLRPLPTPEKKEDISARVNKVIDTRTDENKIPEKVQGYPNPRPPDHSNSSALRHHHWFSDDKFNNASDDADLFTTEIAVDDDEIDLDTMSDEIIDLKPKRHPPAAHVKPTISYVEIDAHAMKADLKLLDSFEELLKYLKQPLVTDKYSLAKTVRAIVIWLSQQKLEGVNYGVKCLDTPRGLLQYLKEGKMTYTTCYTILCRKAGVQCVLINGHVKAACYEPGDTVVPESTWCAVHVEMGWQIVHPFWVCRALFGHNLGGWVKVEKDGKAMHKTEEVSKGVERNTFTERYFMPNPEEFIYECCAEEKEWQLVKPRSVVSSVEEFIQKAYLFPPFFGIGFTLVSDPKCVMHSKEGFCKVEMKARTANAHMTVLKYELFKKETDSESYSPFNTSDEVARMVFNSRSGELFTFDIRFPVTGVYKLVIYGGPYKSAALRICEFKLICDQEMKNRNLLPIECDEVGWGPGPVSVEAGLLMPSKPNGLIPVSEKDQKTEVKFQLRDMKEQYSAVVHGEVDGRRKQLEDKNIEIKKNKQLHQIIIVMNIPGKGEYGLSIQHKDSNSRSKQEKAVCNYLVSTLAYKPEHANVKNAKLKLREAVAANKEPRKWKEQIEEILKCIERCKREKVSDTDDDIIAATAMVWFLTCKDKLRDCILRRNLHVIRRTLLIVSLYKNQDALTKEIMQVKDLEKDIAELRGFARQVPKLEEANKDIVALKHAPDEVHNTFKALLVLLGDSEQNVENWVDIQSRMKASTHTEETSIIGKMKRIQRQEISQNNLDKAINILHKYKEDDVRKVNSDAHSFYVWIENVINVHDTKQEDS